MDEQDRILINAGIIKENMDSFIGFKRLTPQELPVKFTRDSLLLLLTLVKDHDYPLSDLATKLNGVDGIIDSDVLKSIFEPTENKNSNPDNELEKKYKSFLTRSQS